MQLNIKNADAHRMASELARLTGESLTEAVTRAIEQRLDAERRRTIEARGSLAERIRPLVEKINAMPELDSRSGDEILYDEDGLPK
ncbi:MAG: type II toxin-antitoxin system VapB family antitoxin [Bacteroidota bacterium]